MYSNDAQVPTLLDLHRRLRQVLALNFEEALWIRAEIAQIQERKGHHYLNLIYREGEEIVARASAMLWKRAYHRIRMEQGKIVSSILQSGMEVQLQVQVEFHEQYGYQLHIQDLDTQYSLGSLEIQKQATLEKLKSKGLLNLNKTLPLPEVSQRIALVSSPKAAGLEDFLMQIRENPYGYQYEIQLFPAAVQGEKAEQEILRQFKRITTLKDSFDAVVVLRGGGAKTDLITFDSLKLCEAAAQLPLPLLTGIGHDRDEALLDLIAKKALKTPTAVADFLLQSFLEFEGQVDNTYQLIFSFSNHRLQEQQLQLQRVYQGLLAQSQIQRTAKEHRRENILQQINVAYKHRLQLEKQQLTNVEQSVELLGLDATLNRGYSRITQVDGQVVLSPHQLSSGEVLQVRLRDGAIEVKTAKK